MNILVLGGSGFLGSNLTRALVKRGYRPRVFTRSNYSNSNIHDCSDKINLIYGDFMNDVLLKKVVNGIDVVVHLITTTFPSTICENVTYDLMSNLLPTTRLVEICISCGVKKIIYASSGGTIYGEPGTIPMTENHPLNPKSAYGQNKLTIENYLRYYDRTTNIDVQVLRISNPYGPWQNPFAAQGVIATALGCAFYDRKLQIYGKGETVRDYIYVDDVINAFLLAIDKQGSSVVNISTGIGHSVIDVVQLVEKITGRTIRKEFISSRKEDIQNNVLSNDLAYEVYHWKHKVNIERGLADTWEWFLKNKN